MMSLTNRQLTVLGELEAAPRVAENGHIRRTLKSLETAALAKWYRSAKGDIYHVSIAGKAALKVKKRPMVAEKGSKKSVAKCHGRD